jgi:hypothetical protein
MRKHGIYGVVIAALIGAGFITQTSGSDTHPIATVGLSDASYQSHSGGLPANVHPAFVKGTNLPQGLLHQTTSSQTGAALAALTSLLAPPPPAPKAAPKRPTISAAGIKFIEAAMAPKPAPRVVTPAPAPVQVVAPPPAPKPAPTPPPQPAPAPVVSTAPSGGVWAELRQCESNDNYADDTGNGFYGAYQFSLSTWLGLGYGGLPSNAPPSVQDQAAQRLQARSGWGQWPACSARLGL